MTWREQLRNTKKSSFRLNTTSRNSWRLTNTFNRSRRGSSITRRLWTKAKRPRRVFPWNKRIWSCRGKHLKSRFRRIRIRFNSLLCLWEICKKGLIWNKRSSRDSTCSMSQRESSTRTWLRQTWPIWRLLRARYSKPEQDSQSCSNSCRGLNKRDRLSR
jgi:hypothetical protein